MGFTPRNYSERLNKIVIARREATRQSHVGASSRQGGIRNDIPFYTNLSKPFTIIKEERVPNGW